MGDSFIDPTMLNIISMFFVFIAVAIPVVNIANVKKPKFNNFLTYISMSSLSISIYLLLVGFQIQFSNGDFSYIEDVMPTMVKMYVFAIITVLVLNFISILLYGFKHTKKSLAVKKVEKEMAEKEAKKEAKKQAKVEKKEAKQIDKSEVEQTEGSEEETKAETTDLKNDEE